MHFRIGYIYCNLLNHGIFIFLPYVLIYIAFGTKKISEIWK